MNKKFTIINIVLVLIAIFLAYKIFDSIRQPVVFENMKKEREVKVIQHLKNIREAQTLFKNAYGSYTANFDSLTTFVKYGEIPIVNIIPDPNDTTFTKTINDTVGYEKVADFIKGKDPHFVADDMRYVPYSDFEGAKKAVFEMEAGHIKRSGLQVAVYEVRAPYLVYLKGLDIQRIYNAKKAEEDINKYAGMKVGSITEASDAGNWE